MSKSNHRESFVSGIFANNPLFVSLLGICPALAVTKSIEAAIGMGLLFTFVLVCSNVLVSALRKFIPELISTPCYIIIIATFVTLVKMMAEAFLPELYSTLGVFVSLLVVNCVILGRAEAFASKNGVLDSLLDGIGNGIGFTLAIVLIAAVREILGAGTITIGQTFTFLVGEGDPIRLPILKGGSEPEYIIKCPEYDVSLFALTTPAGGFLVLGIVLAIIAAIKNAKARKKTVDERLAKEKAKAEAMAAKAAQAAKEAKQ